MNHILRALLFLALASTTAQARDCWNSDRTFYDCGRYSGGAARSSAPLLGDSLGGNPAALPTETTPFGIEGQMHDRAFPDGKADFGVTTVKGFEGLGIGLGSWSDESFSAPDLPQHFLGSSYFAEYESYRRDPPSTLGLRLGTAVLLPNGPFPKQLRFSLGGSVGWGRVRGDFSPQVGLMARLHGFGIGYSENFERISTSLPRLRIRTYEAGLMIKNAYFRYSYRVTKSSANRTFASAYGARFSLGKWILHGGWKQQKDHRGAPDSWIRGGILRTLGRHIRVGYEHGIYRHSHSGVLQILL